MSRYINGGIARIGLHDSDKTGFPNLALMKLSAYYKKLGADVGWWIPLEQYDRVFSSKVFTFTPEEQALPDCTVKGGTGYGIMDMLPEHIDTIFPDYSLYPECHHAIGFLTRGCIRNCPWCIVPSKEGNIRSYMDWHDIKRSDSRDIVFMDNNVLAHRHGLGQIQSMIGQDVRVDFNQGLDARLISSDVAEILARLKWIRFIRMSCDTDAMLPFVLNAVSQLGRFGVKPYRIFVYLLVQDIQSAERRACKLRSAGVEVFAQPYRDFTNNIEPSLEQRDFARWVNHKAIFKSVERFEDYKPNRRNHDPH